MGFQECGTWVMHRCHNHPLRTHENRNRPGPGETP